MARQKTERTIPRQPDSAYILKLLLYMVLGAQWLRLTRGAVWQIPIPVGFMLGVFFTAHERFQIDRKIEYAVLLTAMFIGFWLPLGVDIIV